MEPRQLIKSPIWDAGKYCVVCGSPEVELHHIFPGSSRKASDRHGYIIPLCREHHTGDTGIHFNRPMALYWMKLAQRHYEANTGTRDEFRKEFGKSYL